MKELITIKNENGKQLVSARELHEGLEIGTRFNDWIKRMIEYGFVENIDYTLVTQKRVTNNPKNPYVEETDYIITIDMAKHIAMVQRTPIGMDFRNYFIECEKQLLSKQTIAPPVDIKDLLELNAVAWNILNINDNSKLQLTTKMFKDNNIPTDYLPVYTEAKDSTHSATDLLKEFEITITTQAFNKLLLADGIIEERERTKGNGKTKKFKTLVDLKYGENLTSPHNPNETIPHYYRNTFEELLVKIGLK